MESERFSRPQIEPAHSDYLNDKLARLAYAGTESVRREAEDRFKRCLSDPTQAAIGFGQQYACGAVLGYLTKLPGAFKVLGGAAGVGLAALALKDEISAENISEMSTATANVWASDTDLNKNICSMQKSLAPLVLDVGPMVLGFLTGRAFSKKQPESVQPLEWRANGKVVEKKGGITRISFKHSDSNFYWPWTQDANEQRLFRQLNTARSSFGDESFAVAEQRRLLGDHFRQRGKLEESGYNYAQAEQVTKAAWSKLDSGETSGTIGLVDKQFRQKIKLATKHFSLAEDQYLKGYALQDKNPLKAAKYYDQSTLHSISGFALHPDESSRYRWKYILQHALEGSYESHYKTGNLADAYASLSRLVTKPDGTIDHGFNSLKLANLCKEMNFHGEAEQLYRGYLDNHPVTLDWANVKRSPISLFMDGFGAAQATPIKGVVSCLERRGKTNEAEILTGVLNKFHKYKDNYDSSVPISRGDLARDIATIKRVLNQTKEFSLELTDFPTVLI